MGSFQVAFRAGLALYAVAEAQAIAISVIFHMYTLVIVVGMGLPFVRGFADLFAMLEKGKELEEEPAA